MDRVYEELNTDDNVLGTSPQNENADTPILRAEVEEAIRMLKTQKSPSVNNVPAELIKHGGEAMIDAFMIMCQKIWETKTWPDEWTKSLIIAIPKKGNLHCCRNYRTISLIRIILN